jgi:hypothetical protein
MLGMARTATAREMAKWCACVLILLAPGSFVIVPLLWLARQWTARGTVLAKSPENRAARAFATQSPRGAPAK